MRTSSVDSKLSVNVSSWRGQFHVRFYASNTGVANPINGLNYGGAHLHFFSGTCLALLGLKTL